MSTMTLEQVRDWLRNCAISCTKSSDISNDFCGQMADAIDAHLDQPAQAVDAVEPIAWAWHSDGMKGWALGHVKPTPENTERFHERSTIVRGLYFDTRALTSEKAGRAVEDPTGFSAEMVLDEANNWTRRHTGKQMLLNYATLLASPAPDKEG